MYELRKPVIADVRGPALAGGCGLATACDFIFAARESARFGYPEVRIGFVPAIVAPFLARRVGEGRAREIMLRGDVVDAVTAASIGLVTAALPAAEMDGVILSLAEELIRRNSGTAMGLCKELLARIQGMNVPEGLEYAANINAAARMTDDCKRGVAAFLKKEQVEW
jgi:methylglutaconyl-CoA hydratase